ncbi:hypothetical protein F2Q70_00012341 [Brassica cretica]|uniref:Uncharacterized protein n=1 Tax=Brassica cretica TaxID=69181 RepID=A0A8S9MDU8_BRACR|nr:hypothetical protein F2Q70_00012341 [Brassica cretica]
MIHESLQLSTVEPSTRQNTQRRSKLTLQHRSTMPIRYRPTRQRKNRSTVFPPWQHTPCIQRSMMKIMRKNELQSKERPLTTKLDFSIILLRKGSRHRLITTVQHPSTLNLNNQTTFDWADNHYHESYAVETAYCDQGDDELNEGFTYEELLNMQKRDETDQNRAATAWERTRFSHPRAVH